MEVRPVLRRMRLGPVKRGNLFGIDIVATPFQSGGVAFSRLSPAVIDCDSPFPAGRLSVGDVYVAEHETDKVRIINNDRWSDG